MPDTVQPRATELHLLSVVEAGRLIERRQISPVELTQAFLDRAEALDPQLNAFLLLTAEHALGRRARRRRRSLPGAGAARCTAFRLH